MKKKKFKQIIIDTPHKNPYNPMSIGPTLNTNSERKTILGTIRKPEVVVGSYAFNRQVKYPFPYQKQPLTDIDVKSPLHKKTALDIEQALDKSANMNNYYVSKLKHDQGTTYRVHSRSRNTVVADVGYLDKKIPTRTIDNVPYETLGHREKEINMLLQKKEAEYRREKDLRMKGYIDRYKRLQSEERRKYRW